jgi:succinoglycan biosynthesis protein ExoM
MNQPAITVCVCTFRRPEQLQRCLESLLQQDVAPTQVVVVDNDPLASATVVENRMRDAFDGLGIGLVWCHEPVSNIARARNRCIAAASCDLIAFIDDDEWAGRDWLRQLWSAMQMSGADGVWGPVEPDFPEDFPDWSRPLLRRRLRADGSAVPRYGGNSGNLLVRREIFAGDPPFDPAYGTSGGEDIAGFARLSAKGCRFIFCASAIVREEQGPERARTLWHLRRSYRIGGTMMRIWHRERGFCYALLRGLAGAPLGFLRGCGESAAMGNARAMMVGILRACAAQLGKAGWCFGHRLRLYGVEVRRPAKDPSGKD